MKELISRMMLAVSGDYTPSVGPSLTLQEVSGHNEYIAVRVSDADTINRSDLVIMSITKLFDTNACRQLYVALQIRRLELDGRITTAVYHSKHGDYDAVSVAGCDPILATDVVFTPSNQVDLVASVKKTATRMMRENFQMVTVKNGSYNVDAIAKLGKSIDSFDANTYVVNCTELDRSALHILNTIYVDHDTDIILTAEDSEVIGFHDNQQLLNDFDSLGTWPKAIVEYNDQQDNLVKSINALGKGQAPPFMIYNEDLIIGADNGQAIHITGLDDVGNPSAVIDDVVNEVIDVASNITYVNKEPQALSKDITVKMPDV